MAEAVMGVLISKLGAALAKETATYGASLLGKEASALKGLFGQIHKAERELESMKAYLRQAEKFKDTDDTSGIFIKSIRELSFQIEDVVDEFIYKLEDNKHGGFAAKMKKRIKHIKVWQRLAHKLCDINAELEEAAKRRARYVIPGIQGHDGSSGHHARSTNQIFCLARENDVVGIEHNATKLKDWLVSDLEEKNYKIVTVWGMGGVGKTTLVDHVYKIVKLEFDAAAWVTVSKSYRAEDLLKRIAREFGIAIDATNMEIRGLVESIRKHLEGKRYILVLDDVWEKDVWINNFMDVFPINCTSRFVITSRKFEVASMASPNCTIHLEPLGNDRSWELFCKVTFRNSDIKRCPSELLDLTVKFLQKCEGLPIAIACIGRLLSSKDLTYTAWNSVYKELEFQSTNSVMRGVDTILKVSLEDLPYELKNCFLYCALFPEDYELKRRRLIKHWITSGFINEKQNQTLEEVAEGYMNDLVNRSLLQVVMKNAFGRTKCCQMHDVIRNIAVDKVEKELFGMIYEGHGTCSVYGARRLSVHGADIAPLNQSCPATQLRAIHYFTTSIGTDFLHPVLASSILLSTLDLQGTQIKILPNEVFNLFNLRFLGLRYTRIRTLPNAIGRLRNLEVLDAAATALVSLPNAIAKLRKLRYLYAFAMQSDDRQRTFCAANMPRGIRHLNGLHALQRITANIETLSEVAALTELRTFAVSGVRSEHSLNLCNAIMNMSHLAHLSLDALNENEMLPLEAVRLPETLNKLELIGQLEKTQIPQMFSSWSHLNNLAILCLRHSKLNEDSFSRLVTLNSLCYLSLGSAYDGKTMCFPAKSFPRLKNLYLWGAPQLNKVKIEVSALENLVELELLNCPELRHLPDGIEYIATLEELSLTNTAEELIEKLRKEHESDECNEDVMKIRHIRRVVVTLTQKNIWERIR